MKTIIALLFVAALAGCQRQADVASENLSRAADSFEINRRIVFYNGITGQYMLELRGLCSLGNADKPRELTVTCKTGPGQYKKHFLGLSDNVTFFAEQIEPSPQSAFYYRVIFAPQQIIPDLDIQGDVALPGQKR
jgi:hypothetical protein